MTTTMNNIEATPIMTTLSDSEFKVFAALKSGTPLSRTWINRLHPLHQQDPRATSGGLYAEETDGQDPATKSRLSGRHPATHAGC